MLCAYKGQIEKLYDIATSAIGTSDNGGVFNSEFSPSFMYQTIVGAGTTSLDTRSMQTLADKFLKLLQTLRGGNHPYLEEYKKRISSLNLIGNDHTVYQ